MMNNISNKRDSVAADVGTTTNSDQSPLNPLPGSANGQNDNKSTTNTKVWVWPWVIFFIFLYVFILIWMNYAILQRYWIQNNWNDSLPGLDKTSTRRFAMRMHMTTGAISILVGLLQFISYFRRSCPRIHRWMGRLYCFCGMSSSIFGLWFISLKQRLVGGYNMTASFALAGMSTGILTFKVWHTARSARFGRGETTGFPVASFIAHRNWGIRSYSQIIAPALYRYWYVMMDLFRLYHVPVPLRMGGYCDDQDFCPDYARTWDAMYCWLYWISAWVVAEIIIRCLPNHDINYNRTITTTDGDTLTIPLLSTNNDSHDGDAPLEGEEQNESSKPSGTAEPTEGTTALSQDDNPTEGRNIDGNGSTRQDDEKSLISIVNLIGCLLAFTTITISGMTLQTVLENLSSSSH
jgi:hypothetical protein